jgi:hypothetical protein
MLNNRDWASIIWLVVLAAYVLRHDRVRASIAAAFRALVHPKIVLALIAIAVYTVGLVIIGHRLDIWTTRLLKDTVVWFIATGFVLFMSIAKSAQGGFFRKAALDAVKVTVFIEFFLNLFVLSLPLELLLLPVLFFVATIPFVASRHPRLAPVVRLANSTSLAIGLAVGAYVVWKVVSDWREVANVGTVQSLALPVWLTLSLMPLIYILSLWVNYGVAFALIDVATSDRRSRWRTKLALLTTLHVRTSAAGSFRWPWVRSAVDSPSFRAARREIKAYRAHHRQGRPQADAL